jgi:hypothetical protein
MKENEIIYIQKIFQHLLDPKKFNSYVIFKKDDGKYTDLLFQLDTVQKLFLKYRGTAAPPNSLPIKTIRTLPQTLLKNSQDGIFLM